MPAVDLGCGTAANLSRSPCGAASIARMAWKKSPPELVAAFDAAIPEGVKVERRVMFGCPALFVRGHMAAGLFEDKVFVRVGEKDVRWMVGEGGTAFEPMKGRPMRGFVVAPDRVRRDGARLAKWVAAGIEHAAALPPKEKTARAKNGAKNGTKKGAKKKPAGKKETAKKK